MRKKINEILNDVVVTTSPETCLLEAVSIMRTNRISCLIVVDEKKHVGIITERDIVKTAFDKHSFADLNVKSIMTSPVLTAPYDLDVFEVYNQFVEHGIRHLALVDSNGLLKGVATQTDVIKAMGPEDFLEIRGVDSVMSHGVISVNSKATVEEAVEAMATNSISSVLVKDKAGTPAGILTERDVLRLVDEGVIHHSLEVGDVMSSPVITVSNKKSLHEIIELMDMSKVRRLIVVDADNKVAGIVTQFDMVKGLETEYIKSLKNLVSEAEERFKKTIGELNESENKYSSLFNKMLNGFAYHKMIFDEDNRPVDYIFLEINDYFESTAGLKRGDIIGKRVTEVLPGIEKSKFDWIGECGKVAMEGGEFRTEQYVEPLDRWHSILVYSNKKGYFAAIFEDITKRKRAEEALLESEGNLVRAQEVAHIGSWSIDLLEDNLIWTDQNYKIFGIPMGTPMNYEKFIEIVHPEDRDYVENKWSAALKGDLYDIEHRLLVDNEVKWVREKAELSFDDNGNPVSGVGITQDITERKRTEDELKQYRDHLESQVEERTKSLSQEIREHKRTEELLKESEERFDIAVRGSGDGMWDWDIKTGKEYFSPRFLEILGYKEGELDQTYDEWASRIHPDDYDRVMKSLKEHLEEGKPYLVDYRHRHRSGEYRWQNSSGQAICDGSGKPVRMVGFISDITERKLTEEKMEFLNTELHSVIVAMSDMEEQERRKLSETLHESLGQYLVTLRLIIKSSLSACACAPEIKERLEEATIILDDAIRVTRNLTAELYPAYLDNNRLSEALNWYEKRVIEQTGIGWSCDISTETDRLTDDEKKVVFRVIRECFRNTLKYARASICEVQCKVDKDTLRLTVKDDGIGFNYGKILENTERGLGLILMNEWAKSLNGTLDIRSQPGKGVKVELELPLKG